MTDNEEKSTGTPETNNEKGHFSDDHPGQPIESETAAENEMPESDFDLDEQPVLLTDAEDAQPVPLTITAETPENDEIPEHETVAPIETDSPEPEKTADALPDTPDAAEEKSIWDRYLYESRQENKLEEFSFSDSQEFQEDEIDQPESDVEDQERVASDISEGEPSSTDLVDLKNETCQISRQLATNHENIGRVLESIQEKIEGLSREFQGKIKYDAHKEKLIDSLHQELQEYKNDLLKKHMMSMIMDIIKIIDNIRKLTAHYAAMDPSEIDPAKLLDILKTIPSDLEDLFSWQGIKPFSSVGAPFAPNRQKVLKKIETTDEQKNKTIAESLRPGYEWEGKILRPEMVSVYVLKPKSSDIAKRDADE